MEFALTSDQMQFQSALNRALQRSAPLDRVRRFANDKEDVAIDVWGVLADLGVSAVLIPPEQGGLGLGLLDAALIAEALGRHATPSPFLSCAVLAPLALMAAGSQAQKSRWLPGLASGEVRAAVALSEAVSGARDGAGIQAREDGLFGSALYVLDAPGAELFILADSSGDLHLVKAGGSGVALQTLTTIDQTRRFGELTLEGAMSEPLQTGAGALEKLRDAAWVMLAADALGAAEAMIEQAVAYAQIRQQFGRPIGSFQAVKHLCAEMAAELEPARSLVWYAAYAVGEGLENAGVAAAHAKAHLSEIGRFIARTSTEVHGGMGITDRLGLHYWFKRIGLNRQLLGGPERVRLLAAQMQGLA